MSLLKANAVQLGQSLTASQNFTWYQPATPDGTVRLGNGNSGSVTDLVTLTSAGNLGIGTSSPLQKLDVRGRTGLYGSSDAYQLKLSYAVGTAGFWLGSPSANALSFYNDAGTEFMRLDSSGNLGLGVTPSGWSSLARAEQIGSRTSVFNFNNSNTYLTHNHYINTSSQDIYLANDYATMYRQSSGIHYWYTAPSGTAGNAISFTQAMTLDASGRLYVKQTSQSGNTAQRVGVTFDGSSEWGINVTTSSNSGNAVNFTNASGTQIGQIQVSSTATAYVTSSDQRLKTNITPAGSAIQSILDFPVDQFDWISFGQHQDFGAIAQKAINVIPEMVSVPANEDEMWGIDWSKAVPRLIKTIQELSAELNELKQKVNA